ncbi:hypothetical protein CVT24_011369 [Panaeolus cyanescens]|uniref:Fungal-type protein kinase domain-containing protein n=1 Tax=Panaeolus cyanescens TaxID=181874 RepID=A0A409YGN2_9AGAR|nr:hypothetical protein CVT24_011369 [Panaeolus cyanescens]
MRCPYLRKLPAGATKLPMKPNPRNPVPNTIHYLTGSELNQLLMPVATNDQIQSYLATSKLFYPFPTPDGCRWHGLPHVANHETELYTPTDIHSDFYILFDEDVLKNHKKSHITSQWDSDIWKPHPALATLAKGDRHFHPGPANTPTGLDLMLTPVEIRLCRWDTTMQEACNAQCTFYADEIFKAQPGRRSVIVPVFTENYAQLQCFDHAGVVRSWWVNIHENPETFVRMVIFALARPTLSLGVNPMLTWEGQQSYLTVRDIRYRIDECIFHRQRAEGVPCAVWKVTNPEGIARVIKWNCIGNFGGSYESTVLAHIQGSEGVVQVVDTQDPYSTLASRGFDTGVPFGDNDVIEHVVVMEGYGDNISRFTSPKQLLHAFRDAIAGHQNMWEKGVVHRDISYKNILLGTPGAPKGFRGVVIDMDRARLLPKGMPTTKAESWIGTRPFQSFNVVRSDNLPEAKRTYHDYLDDLESFFWVFIYITNYFKCIPNEPARHLRELPPMIQKLSSDNPHIASDARRKILITPSLAAIHQSYPPQFEILKAQLTRFFVEKVLLHPKKTQRVSKDVLREASNKHYAEILGFFDGAIADHENGIVRNIKDVLGDKDNGGDGVKDPVKKELITPLKIRIKLGGVQVAPHAVVVRRSARLKRKREEEDAAAAAKKAEMEEKALAEANNRAKKKPRNRR